ncbi:hypothetical protein [Streptomyces malaysiensis]|uniref:hypothetical protein n=1 Tax=Streptomyces malaysiensis TaxID=92644 RepID=UPI00371135AE
MRAPATARWPCLPTDTTGLGDEGGFAPALDRPEAVLQLLVEAITDVGYTPGREGVAIALDPAAGELRGPDGRYRLAGDTLSGDQLIDGYETIVELPPLAAVRPRHRLIRAGRPSVGDASIGSAVPAALSAGLSRRGRVGWRRR